jgi:hypothetical protein
MRGKDEERSLSSGRVRWVQHQNGAGTCSARSVLHFTPTTVIPAGHAAYYIDLANFSAQRHLDGGRSFVPYRLAVVGTDSVRNVRQSAHLTCQRPRCFPTVATPSGAAVCTAVGNCFPPVERKEMRSGDVCNFSYKPRWIHLWRGAARWSSRAAPGGLPIL